MPTAVGAQAVSNVPFFDFADLVRPSTSTGESHPYILKLQRLAEERKYRHQYTKFSEDDSEHDSEDDSNAKFDTSPRHKEGGQNWEEIPLKHFEQIQLSDESSTEVRSEESDNSASRNYSSLKSKSENEEPQTAYARRKRISLCPSSSSSIASTKPDRKKSKPNRYGDWVN